MRRTTPEPVCQGESDGSTAEVDLSGHVEHLRFVHFSLMAACAALLIVSSAARKGGAGPSPMELGAVKGIVEMRLGGRSRRTPFGEPIDTTAGEQGIDFWVSRSAVADGGLTL